MNAPLTKAEKPPCACSLPWTAPARGGLSTASPADWPKITIVTPNYNQGQFLEATLSSVLCQNYPNLEYVVIDGGSTDGSIDIIRRYEPLLAFWTSEPDNGQYDAINKGMARASGDILAWLNSDDMYMPWTLRTVAEIFSACPQVQWLTSLNQMQCTVDGIFDGVFQARGFSRDCFLDGGHLGFGTRNRWYIQQEATFWSRSMWERVEKRIREQYSLAGDFDLWARFFEHAELTSTTVPLAAFRSRPGQASKIGEAEYGRQAEAALDEARRVTRHRPSRARDAISVGWKLFGVPPRRLARLVGYESSLAVRSDGRWTIERDCFL